MSNEEIAAHREAQRHYLLRVCDGPESIVIYTSEDEGVVDCSNSFPAVYVEVTNWRGYAMFGPFELSAIYEQLIQALANNRIAALEAELAGALKKVAALSGERDAALLHIAALMGDEKAVHLGAQAAIQCMKQFADLKDQVTALTRQRDEALESVRRE